MNESFRLVPEQASRTAAEVDQLSLAILIVAAIFTFGISATIVYFSIRYWHGREANREILLHPRTGWLIEITWMVVPLLILLGFFGWGAKIYFRHHRPPADALNVHVVAKQWMWKVGHESGRREIDTLHVPTHQPVRLTMISEDVIHSFYVPAFRTKQDVLPGRYTTMWFEANRPGTYHLFCAEYCGTSHSRMVGRIVVQTPEDYTDWVLAGETPTAAEAGFRWLNAFGCMQCHGEGSDIPAPPLAGLFGRSVPLSNGRSATADSDYLRRAILEPNAEVVAGYKPQMPSFEGEITPEQMLDIIAYLRSVADASGPVAGPGNHVER